MATFHYALCRNERNSFTANKRRTYVTAGLVSCGGGGSDSSPLPVAAAPPAVLQEPQDQTVGVGASATFTVTFASPPPTHVQWLKGTTPIPGATSTTYTTPPTRSADDGLTYSVQYAPPFLGRFSAYSRTRLARLTVAPVPAAAGTFVPPVRWFGIGRRISLFYCQAVRC